MTRSRQHGFTVIGAIFILVVLALLGAFMVTISNAHHMVGADASLGSRAYFAARSGTEWGGAQATGPGCAAANGSPAFAAYLEFTVTVTCVDGGSTHTEHGVTYDVYQISATATRTGVALGSPGYVSRTLHLVVTSTFAPF